MEKQTSKDKISEFLIPDPIWKIIGLSTQEDFIDNFITEGKFHNNVPDTIRNDFKVVERIQFYSFYNYPLIDEAFGKSTRIFEASVDLKISELGLAKQGFEPLTSKIKKLEQFTSADLLNQWLKTKEIRNLFAHHKAGRLWGIILVNAFKSLFKNVSS